MEVQKQPVGEKANEEPESRFQYSLELRRHDGLIIPLNRATGRAIAALGLEGEIF